MYFLTITYALYYSMGLAIQQRYFYRNYGKLFVKIRQIYHEIIVSVLGLDIALRRKYRRGREKRFITQVEFKKRDLKMNVIYGYIPIFLQYYE